jgi:hypothetical protein
MIISFASAGPSPATACVAWLHSGQARHPATARAIAGSPSPSSEGAGGGDHSAPRRGLGGRGGDHLGRAPRRGGDEVGNERGLRQVAPEALRHLRAHGVRIDPRRIEHAAVVAAPQAFERVVRRRLRGVRACRESQPLAVPRDAAARREDRPAHGGEALGEEGRRGLDDVMVGLVPGDEGLLRLALDPAEAHEGVHLVDVAAHRLGELRQPHDVRIGRQRQQPRLVA